MHTRHAYPCTFAIYTHSGHRYHSSKFRSVPRGRTASRALHNFTSSQCKSASPRQKLMTKVTTSFESNMNKWNQVTIDYSLIKCSAECTCSYLHMTLHPAKAKVGACVWECHGVTQADNGAKPCQKLITMLSFESMGRPLLNDLAQFFCQAWTNIFHEP